MRRLRKQVRLGLIGSVAVVTGLVGVVTFAATAGAKPHPTTTTTTSSTTTSTSSTTTTTASTTTTTLVPCNAQPSTATGGAATMTVTPGTCLNGGTVVTITGSGFDPSSLGIVLQCSSDATQPTVSLDILGSTEVVPVSCSGLALSRAVATTSTGGIPTSPKATTFTVVSGTVGPPCGATGDLVIPCPADSSNGGTGNATTDAANYPCPPSPAEVAAGVGPCIIVFADKGGAKVQVPITYVPPAQLTTGGGGSTSTAPATSSSTTGGTSSTTATTTAPTTAATSSSLAFTGTGTGLYVIGAAGLIMVVLGGALLGFSGAPGSLVMALRRRRRSS